MKNAIGKIAFGVVVLVIVFWLFTSSTSKKSSETENQERKIEKHQQIEKIVADLVSKYNAITDWRQSFKKEGIGLLEPVFTIEVQDALIRKDNRPVLFFAAVEDIEKETGIYNVYFQNFFDIVFSANILYVLDCSTEQIQEIMKQPTSPFKNYAVVAQITNVRKIRYGVTSDDEKNVKDDSSLPSNVFEAKGRCLDLLFVDDYEPKELSETKFE